MIAEERGRVVEEIKALQGGTFRLENGRPKPDSSVAAILHGATWDDLSFDQRKDALEKFVNWEGLSGREAGTVVTHAVVSRTDYKPEAWFEGPVAEPAREVEIERE